MKKQITFSSKIKQVLLAVFTTIVLLGAANVAQAQQTAEAASPYVNYLGLKDNLAAFNVHFNNSLSNKFVLELVNDEGDILYSKKFTVKTLDKQILLKNVSESDKYKVSFIIRAGKNVFTHGFNIDTRQTLVNNLVVTRL